MMETMQQDQTQAAASPAPTLMAAIERLRAAANIPPSPKTDPTAIAAAMAAIVDPTPAEEEGLTSFSESAFVATAEEVARRMQDLARISNGRLPEITGLQREISKLEKSLRAMAWQAQEEAATNPAQLSLLPAAQAHLKGRGVDLDLVDKPAAPAIRKRAKELDVVPLLNDAECREFLTALLHNVAPTLPTLDELSAPLAEKLRAAYLVSRRPLPKVSVMTKTASAAASANASVMAQMLNAYQNKQGLGALNSTTPPPGLANSLNSLSGAQGATATAPPISSWGSSWGDPASSAKALAAQVKRNPLKF
jgi:hypothetical protein